MLLSKFQQGDFVYVFVYIDKLILKFTWKGTDLQTANRSLKYNKEMGGITLPNIMAYDIAI